MWCRRLLLALDVGAGVSRCVTLAAIDSLFDSLKDQIHAKPLGADTIDHASV